MARPQEHQGDVDDADKGEEVGDEDADELPSRDLGPAKHEPLLVKRSGPRKRRSAVRALVLHAFGYEAAFMTIHLSASHARVLTESISFQSKIIFHRRMQYRGNLN